MADWRKSFKSEWKKQPDENNFSKYCVSIENWVCGCPYYLTNRFMICKHLVNLKELVDFSLFKTLKRNNQYPFIIWDKTHMCEINTHTRRTLSKGNDTCMLNNGGSDIHSDHETNNTDIFENLIDIMQQTLNLLKEQKRSRNVLWAQGVERNFNQIKTMVMKYISINAEEQCHVLGRIILITLVI